MTTCGECGFDYDDHPSEVVVSELGCLGGRFRTAFAPHLKSVGLLIERRSEGVWSPLEYACHVRDVLLAQRERVLLALVEDRPSFAPIYRDQRVVLARYAEDDPIQVIGQLETGASMIAFVFGGLSDESWHRECIYNYPEPSRRSLAWLAAHTLHEGEHHLGDVERQLVPQ